MRRITRILIVQTTRIEERAKKFPATGGVRIERAIDRIVDPGQLPPGAVVDENGATGIARR